MCGGNRRFPTARRAKRQRADHPAAADGFQRKPLSAKRKSTLPGAFSFGYGGQFRLDGTRATYLDKKKEPGTRIASRLSLVVEAGGIEPPSESPLQSVLHT